METSRKRKADTCVVGFQGVPVSGPANAYSVQYMDATHSALRSALDLAPTLEQVMRSAAEAECTYIRGDWCDAFEAQALAEESEWRSRDELTAAGYLP